MTRGILLAGNESLLLTSIDNETAKRVQTHAAARILHSPAQQANVRYLDWNPASPLSARTLVLTAQNKLERIDEAVLVCVPPACRKPPEALPPAELDRLIDDHIKSWFFLVRELISVFKNRQKGTLALVIQEAAAGQREDVPDLIGPSIAASYKSLVQGLLLSAANAPYSIMGFTVSAPGMENAFAAYIYKTIEEGKRNSGKWHKYGKFGLFGR